MFFLFLSTPALAQAPIEPQKVTQVTEVVQVKRLYTKMEMVQLATEIALKNDLNVEKFHQVINCESGWNQNAEGDHLWYKNEEGVWVKGEPTSFGPVQLHYPLRDWGVTREQAKDPEIAFNIMAKAWRGGLQGKWTCY